MAGDDHIQAHSHAIHIVMAVYQPQMEALERQVQSVLGQTAVDVRLYLFADGPDALPAGMGKMFARDKRIEYLNFETNRGPADTFLEGLARVLPANLGNDGLFAFADQDDVWHPHKLAATARMLRSESLSAVHADARLVDGAGRVISSSMFAFEARDSAPDLERLFFRNNVTGMTLLLSSDAARAICDLRAYRPAGMLHDHFAALVASSIKGLGFLDLPCVDYIQHGANAIGAKPASSRLQRLARLRSGMEPAREYLRQGEDFFAALEQSDWLSPDGRREVNDLRSRLQSGGTKGLFDAAHLLRRMRVTNPVATRLALEKLRLARREKAL